MWSDGNVAKRVFLQALKSVDPYRSVQNYIPTIIKNYEKFNCTQLYVVAFGKSAELMSAGVMDNIGDIVTGGIAIVPNKYIKNPWKNKKIKLFTGGHPLPDKNSLLATKRIIKLLEGVNSKTLVVFLISGGGSSLLVSPVDGVTLREKINITRSLLKCGAKIQEINAVRKHLSKVKGGRLAEITYPSRMLSLIISDVIDDPLDTIASGPTAPDSTTYRTAIQVLRKYGLIDQYAKIFSYFNMGLKGIIPETPKHHSPVFKNVNNIIIASNRMALMEAKNLTEKYGYYTKILTHSLSGDARKAGEYLALQAIKHKNYMKKKGLKKMCIVTGGETTVRVTGKGKGGRNQELALTFASKIRGIPGITLLSAGTDGIDGNTDAAGAIVDGFTIEKGSSMGLNYQDYQKNNDSYNFLKATGNLIFTGPTGTNVMDMQIMIIRMSR